MSMKEAYAQKLDARLAELRAEIDRLKARADGASADAQLEYYKEIEKLRSMQDHANDKLRELQEAGDDAWEDLKLGAESAWESLSSAVRHAASRFD